MTRRLRILHAIHDYLPRHQAGSELYAANLARALRARGHHVTILTAAFAPDHTHGDVQWRIHDGIPVVEVVNNWSVDGFAESYRATTLQPIFEHVLRAVAPDVLHVHSLLNLTFDLPALAGRRGIPVCATLHDYTLVCASGGQRLHRADQHLCREIDAVRCARCFTESPFHAQLMFGAALQRRGGGAIATVARALRKHAPRLLTRMARPVAQALGPAGPSPDAIRKRMTAGLAAAAACDLIVAPSRAIAAEFIALGVPSERLTVADYGFPPMAMPARSAPRAGPLRIGFVGTLVWHKGAHVLIDAVSRLPAGAAELRIFGDTGQFPDYVAELARAAAQSATTIEFAGRFEHATRADTYAQMDVLVVPSLWLENSPLVVHEAFQAGLPVVGSRLGGIADLVTDGLNGRLYEPHAADELAGILRQLSADRRELERLASARTPVLSIEHDAAEWEARYQRLVAPRAVAAGS
jgi:glycosyltransferase involved in cell wall biosynthesis